jgi:Tol biopolymer transport system component/subtilisin-like proprotein convertase family protein
LLAGVQLGTEVHWLDTAHAAIDQITQTLLGRTGISSLHIVSHGKAGGLALGTDWLNLDNLRSYSGELQSWGNALTADADLLLYGCEVGQGAIGQSFVQQLAQLTGADIAASDDLTGSAALGGDWILEFNTGEIAASLVFQASAIANYQHVLPVDLISTADPTVPNDTAGGSDYFNISDDGRYVGFASSAGNLVANDTNNSQDIFVRDLQTGSTVLVSANSSSTATGNAASYISEISGNGRYVTFISDASDLVANDNNTTSDVFVRDLVTNTTTLVSVNSSGTGGGNASTTIGSLRISSDGRYVTFTSSASDLVANDSNNQSDVFRRDLVTGTTLLVSGNSTNTASGNGTSSIPSMTKDGRYVVFASTASNLVTNDTNGTTKDVFRWDSVTSVTTLVSANSSGTGSGNSLSGDANVRISDDGRYVAFTSTASNLVANDTNGSFQDVFVRDVQGGTTTLVSVNSSGTGSGNGTSIAPPSLSSDGRYVAFASSASNLVANDTNGSQQDVFLRDLQTGTTTLVSADSSGTGSGNGLSGNASSGGNFVRLSSDGRYIAFASSASNLVANDTNGQADVFVRDRIAGTTTLVSQTSNGNAGNGGSYSPSPFSSTGRIIFASSASDLSANDANGAADVFVYDATTNTNTLVSQRDPALPPSVSGGGSSSTSPNSLSTDGRYVVFTSVAGNLVANDSNNAQDVFLRDRTTGITTLISRTSTGSSGNSYSDQPSISSDGRYVVYVSSASNLVAGDNNSTSDVFSYDRVMGTTTLVSHTNTGTSGNNVSNSAVISSDGRFIAFGSSGSDLVANDSNNQYDVFVWDRQTSNVTLVSHTSTGSSSNGYSYPTSISNDGRYVVFSSTASNLVTGDGNSAADVFLWDRQIDTINLVSRASTGSSGISQFDRPVISGDGNYVVFASNANNLVTGDGNGAADVFLWERQTGNVTLVSRTSTGNSGNSSSTAPVISHDGRYVAFASEASNLTAGDSNFTTDVYVYDRQTNTVKLISHTNTGSSGNSYATAPVMSADGQYIVFSSGASNLASSDINGGSADVFLWDRQTDRVSLVSRTNTGTSGNGASSNTVLSSDGTYLVFSSGASNLVTGDLNGLTDVFGAQISSAPMIALPGSNLTYVENNPATVLDGNATVVDTDSPNFNTGQLTVSLATNGTVADRLAILNQGDGAGQVGVSGSNVTYGGTIIGSLVGGMGTTPLVITFNANANGAAVQAVLRNLTFANVADGPSTAPRTVSLVLTDNTGITSNTATKTINVTAVNDAPPAVQNDSYSTNEDTALMIAAATGVLSNDTDLDNDPMTATVVTGPSNGILAFNPNGSFNYSPNLNFNGTDSFTYRVSDGTANSAIATATINVNPVNDAPVNTVPSNLLTTNSSNPTSITIPSSGAGTPYGSTINVSGVNGTISQLRVTLSNLSHTYPDDLDVLLVGPGGQRLLLLSDAGGSARVSNVTLTFSDAATVALPDSGLISSGTYRPTNYDTSDAFPSPAPTGPYGSTLSLFNGTNPNGAWKLYVVDDAGSDTGAIAGGWSLSLETNGGGVKTTKGIPFVFSSANGHLIAVSDVDAGNSPVQVTLAATNGLVTLNGTIGLTVTGNNTANLNITGTLAAINTALNGLRFTPTNNFVGAASLQLVTNDQGNTGTPGPLSNTSTILITVLPNTAPTLADTTINLNPINEDAGLPVGAVGTLVSQLAALTGGGGQNNVTDADAGAVTGIAITATDSSNGNWFYSTDHGSTWSAIGSVSNTSARLLKADTSTRLYFQPKANFDGMVTNGVTFRAWDQTSGSNGSTADTTNNGNDTAFSTGTDTAAIAIAAVNDALLWRDSVSGENAVWQLNGSTLQSSYYLPPVADLNWQMISTADFNRDGNADILWRHQATGENSVWLMNSTGFQTSYYLPPVADANWRIMGTDDFTGDGTADLVWRNQVTGENAIWQMNRTGFQTSYYLNPVADANWQIVSTADFNADGVADLLWRNQATGENSIWRLNSTGLQTAYYINPVGDANWQVVGTADLNNDGIADLVWRNRATGENSLWQMNSTGLQTSYYINPVADANWQVVGVADLGGTSTPDLLWRNTATGQTDIWQLSGFSFLQSYQLPTAASEWSVRPFAVA